MGGFVLQCNLEDEASPICVESETFVELIDSDVLDWPSMSDSEIDDRSKADWVIKTIALAQGLWFVTQVIGRAIQGLPITTLELFTLNVVVGAAVM